MSTRRCTYCTADVRDTFACTRCQTITKHHLADFSAHATELVTVMDLAELRKTVYTAYTAYAKFRKAAAA